MAITIPQVGNAPIAPPTQPTLQQEAFTAVLPTTENLNQDLMKANQINYAIGEAKHQQEQKKIADRLAMFDFDTSPAWEVDTPAINDEIQKGIKQFGTVDFYNQYYNGDINALTQYQQWKNKVNGLINKSKLDRALYYEQNKYVTEHGADGYGTDEDYQNIDQFKNTGLQDRTWNGYAPRDFYNPIAIAGEVLSKKIVEPTVTSTDTPMGGNQTKKITITEVPLTGTKSVEAGLNAILNTAKFSQQLSTHYAKIKANILNGHQNDFTIPIYDLKTTDANGQPTVIDNVPMSTATSEQIANSEYVPLLYQKKQKQEDLQGAQQSLSGGGAGDNEAGGLKWVVDNLSPFVIKEGDTKTVTIPTLAPNATTIMGEGGTKTEQVPAETTALRDFSVKETKNGKTIYHNVDKIQQDSEGNTVLLDEDGKEIRKVKVYWDDIIVPYVTQKGGVGGVQKLQQLADYYNANYPDLARKLGVPKDATEIEKQVSKTGTQQQGGVKSGGGLFDDLGNTPQKKSQVINTPQQNQQVAPQKQVVTPQTNTTTAPQQQVTTPQKTATPPQTAPTKTPPVNNGTSNWGKTDNQPKSEVKTFPTDRGSYNGGNDYMLNGEKKYQKGEDIEFNGKKYEVKNFFEDGKPSVNRTEKYDANGKLIEAKNESTNSTYKYSYFETEDGTKYYHNRGACGEDFCFHSYWGTEKPNNPQVGNFDKKYMYAYKGNDATMTKPNDLKVVNSSKKIYQSGNIYYKTVDTEQGVVYVEQIKNNDGTFTDKKHNYSGK